MHKPGVIFIMVLSFFAMGGQKSPEASFWAWFEKNDDALFNFDRDQARQFAKLNKALSRVHPALTFEFGPDRDGKREFVISADGIREAFPAVKALHAAAPDLPRWTFIKFRPRRPPMTVLIGDIRLCPEDLEVALQAEGDRAGLTVFGRGFDASEPKPFTHAVFLLLDQTLGEYDMETKVGFIDVKAWEEESTHQRHPLADFAIMFDAFMAR